MGSSPRLVMLGRQGAGKGTQGQRLARHFGVVHISTGDALRDAVRSETIIGRTAKRYMDAGELVPDDVMLSVVQSRLTERAVVRRGFVLDGFPRTVAQAGALFEALDGDAVDAAVD